ncbi:hypothetical protein EV714DRAFT_277477 [Schizophyllum commune]
MAAPTPRKVNVAIVGGGIGGLTLALAMQRFYDMSQLDVHIYEAASQFSQIGAGINIWGRVRKIFTDLGLEADLARLLREDDMGYFTCRKSDQAEGQTFRDVYIENGKMMLLHRAEVQDLLLKHISPDIKIHLSHRLTDYSYTNHPTERIEMRFRSGQVAHCDLLIAADGVHSVTRRVFLSNLAEKTDRPELRDALAPVFSGTHAYRGLVAPEQLAEVWPNHPVLKKPFIYCGKDKHVVAYPISCGRAVNVIAFYTDMSKEDTPFEGSQIGQATTEQVMKTYEGWEPDVRAILSCMRNPSHWAIITQKPLDIWADDGVFLLGDAAHAMTTHLGAGAGQAIEDAYILAQILAREQRKGPLVILSSEAMALYNRLRPPIANFVLSRARLQNRFYEFNEEGADLGLLQKDSPALTETDRLARIGLAIWDGFHWREHPVVQETDAEVARAMDPLLD